VSDLRARRAFYEAIVNEGDGLTSARSCIYGVVIGAFVWTLALAAWWWASS
jgi:hypothetical protein